MTPRRLSCAAAVLTGLLLVGLAPTAHARTGPVRAAGADRDERAATALLERAVTAGRRLEYRGTQHVTVWHDGAAYRSSAQLAHDPATGSTVTGRSGAHPEAAGDTAVLDPRVLDRLAAAYRLSVRGPVRCAGRTASLVEARRADGAVAGRLWVDRASGLLLRREVYDGQGRRARSTALVDLAVEPSRAAGPGPARVASGAVGPAGLQGLREQGWPVPEQLPGGFRLLEARVDDPVLQLAYTDGLSTLSVFVQPGGLGGTRLDGFAPRRVGGWPVMVRRTAPERVVWSDGRHAYTVVSDAPEPAVLAVVAALPHRAEDGGLLGRLQRGTARLAALLNPLD